MKGYKLVPEIFTRFKVDIEIAIESLESGSKLVEDKIVVDETKKLSDENRSLHWYPNKITGRPLNMNNLDVFAE